jgi:DNA-binding NarL/FixJ family response regulator
LHARRPTGTTPPDHDGEQQRSRPGRADPREREVVVLIALGLSNEQIARKIYVSPSTAKTYAARAMTKLQARDRAQLVVFAYQAGLVRPDWS